MLRRDRLVGELDKEQKPASREESVNLRELGE
jgi:hypothetical protein